MAYSGKRDAPGCEMKQYIQVTTTIDSVEGAEQIARSALEKRLAACVQISQCSSLYRWQGKIEQNWEFLCVMKSRSDLFEQLELLVQTVHSYEVPEIIATTIINIGRSYSDWLDRELLP